MKKMLLLLSVLVLSTSCLSLDGALQVTEAITLKKKAGFLNTKTSTVNLTPGLYKASLQVKSDKNYNLELSGGGLSKSVDIPIKADRSLNIPSNGSFVISSAQIDQPVDINGTISTQIDNTGYSHAIESCSWETVENKCEKVCTRERGCEVICREERITRQGRKDIDYHFQTIRRDISFELTRVFSTGRVALFAGRNVETNKIIDRESSCR